MDARLLSALSGVAVIVAVALLARGRTSVRLAGRRGAVLAGAASGAMNLIGGVGGPPVALYAANAGWPIERVRPTLMAFFAVQNAVTVAVIGWVWPSAALVVALVIGSVLGVAPGEPAGRGRGAHRRTRGGRGRGSGPHRRRTALTWVRPGGRGGR